MFQASQWQELLVSLHKLPIPEPGVPVHLGVVSPTSLRYVEPVVPKLFLQGPPFVDKKICSQIPLEFIFYIVINSKVQLLIEQNKTKKR